MLRGKLTHFKCIRRAVVCTWIGKIKMFQVLFKGNFMAGDGISSVKAADKCTKWPIMYMWFSTSTWHYMTTEVRVCMNIAVIFKQNETCCELQHKRLYRPHACNIIYILREENHTSYSLRDWTNESKQLFNTLCRCDFPHRLKTLLSNHQK